METLFRNEAQQHRELRRAFFWAEMVCLAIGFGLVGWWGWNQAATVVSQSWANYELNAELRHENATLLGYVGDIFRGSEDVEPPARAERPATPPATPRAIPQTGDLIGRIEIPDLKISAIVRQGVDDGTLSRAVGHVPQTALPGQTGNVGIAAHRDTHFRNLKGVKVGDTLRMVTPEGTYEYAVESMKIVRPKDVYVLDPTPDPVMTLVTCYPFNYIGNAPKRYIVKAKQIGVAQTAPDAAAELHKSAAKKRTAVAAKRTVKKKRARR
jgi:sortase A